MESGGDDPGTEESRRSWATGIGRTTPLDKKGVTGRLGLHLGLFRDFQSIVNLDPEIPDRAFKLCMAQQELYRPQVLCSPQRMGSVPGRIQTDRFDPRLHDPGVLPCR